MEFSLNVTVNGSDVQVSQECDVITLSQQEGVVLVGVLEMIKADALKRTIRGND